MDMVLNESSYIYNYTWKKGCGGFLINIPVF